MNQRIRQLHRWLSIAFVVAVIITFIVMAQDNPAVWMSFLPLPPLFLLTFSGLYLFALPYLTKWRSQRTS